MIRYSCLHRCTSHTTRYISFNRRPSTSFLQEISYLQISSSLLDFLYLYILNKSPLPFSFSSSSTKIYHQISSFILRFSDTTLHIPSTPAETTILISSNSAAPARSLLQVPAPDWKPLYPRLPTTCSLIESRVRIWSAISLIACAEASRTDCSTARSISWGKLSFFMLLISSCI